MAQHLNVSRLILTPFYLSIRIPLLPYAAVRRRSWSLLCCVCRPWMGGFSFPLLRFPPIEETFRIVPCKSLVNESLQGASYCIPAQAGTVLSFLRNLDFISLPQRDRVVYSPPLPFRSGNRPPTTGHGASVRYKTGSFPSIRPVEQHVALTDFPEDLPPLGPFHIF